MTTMTTQDAIDHASMLALGFGTSSALVVANGHRLTAMASCRAATTEAARDHAAHMWDFWADVAMALLGLAPDNIDPTQYSSKYADMAGPDCEAPLTSSQKADYRDALRRLAEGR